MTTFRQAIHGDDPYAGFPIADHKLDLRGFEGGDVVFGSDCPLFEAVITTFQPQRMIEVGSWKGASAVRMAGIMKKHGIAGEILCVDTFLGSAENWLDRTGPNFVPPRFGRPALYEQFLANVILSGSADIVTPLPLDSLTAAAVITGKRLQADVIYLDAGHDYDHASADLKAWWPIVRPGGLLFGDDYHPRWQGVVSAVDEFAAAHSLKLQIEYANQWYCQKPV